MSAQTVLLARLLELPVEALAARIEDECLENPWLEKVDPASGEESDVPQGSGETDMEYNPADDYRSEDDIPSYQFQQGNGRTAETMEYGDTLTFYDHLQEQASEYDLNEHKQTLLQYLIGSLDEDGLLRKPLRQMADELAIYQAIDTTEEELEEVLHTLWQFDPPGIGARSLQECLRLQILRGPENTQRTLMLQIVDGLWEDFTHNRWDIIARRMKLTEGQTSALQHELTRLNPRPGSSLGEQSGRAMEQVTPDFVVENDGYDHLSFYLNDGGLPGLQVSPDALQEANEFTSRYVNRGNLFIAALRHRRQSMTKAMAVILDIQRAFFLEGDESLLRPMLMEDVATRTALDVSTISRICNHKYVQTPFGTYPLRWFFTQRSVQRGDETLSTHQVMAALRGLIEAEDKRNPLGDEKLADAMQVLGYNIARRTIAKYRDAMGIPVARMRKKS